MLVRVVVCAAVITTAAICSASPAAGKPVITVSGGIATSPLPFPQCQAGQDRESPGCVEKPDANSVGAMARCRDGSYSHSQTHSGTCSGHHGVAQWCPCGSVVGESSFKTVNRQASVIDAKRVVWIDGSRTQNPESRT
ncbi:DUF3761 domain-containing protein [Mycobacterium sp. 852002-51971_SCH5477799-a]|uniref:DUF3761 domain-containing protein n=1 Tax=Mycobacterium sp. 852002-51971_SCH5477799-a TaxID=1834106 RepID=UPI0009ED60A5|nr:DUF3761 domain-containing protein [Mycobacterium sp. 852002-51971_SCH5477799-a]